ncbi:Hypothetical predicted protein [Lecanosticta acicola]|uniref:SnoaL-like domain-containing protein n=1 Tax=Lecanosticta acicola TaxID=111012 RepID=A0AAI8Z5J2_9PEZI|nr:Hypothetical predicted protein [Lecanosticta acicola]
MEYDKLASTATNFITACAPKSPNSNTPDAEAILGILAPDARLQWGHKTFIASSPWLQGHRTPQEFVQHMSGMASKLGTWKPSVTNTIVDVRKRRVMLRADFHMTAQNGTTVLNDIIFIIDVDESLEKIVTVTEFIDPKAAELLREAIQA